MTMTSAEEAERIASHLVRERLVACVNIGCSIRSLYWWKGELCDDGEILCIAKTTADLFDEVAKAVNELHSYEVPEIIFCPIEKGTKEYLGWIAEVTK
jgi:periplasmic divalent cation tolerance protein